MYNNINLSKQFRIKLVMIIRIVLKTSQEITEYQEESLQLTDDLQNSRDSQYSIFETQETLLTQIQQLNKEEQKIFFSNLSKIELF